MTATTVPPVCGRLARVGHLDCLIVRINGKVPDGLQGAAELHPVVALLSDPTPRVVREVLDSRAAAVIDASCGISPEDLAEAVRMVRQHGVHVDARLQGMALKGMSMDSPLTRRQHEVLELYASGRQQATIARSLGIEVGTVRDHYRAIRERLEVASMAEAVDIARARRLL